MLFPSIEEALTKIRETRETYQEKKKELDDTGFAVFAADLSLYNCELAEHIAQLKYDADSLEGEEYEKLRVEKSQGDAEKLARKTALEARRMHETAKYVYSSTDTFIDSLRTLSARLSERKKL